MIEKADGYDLSITPAQFQPAKHVSEEVT